LYDLLLGSGLDIAAMNRIRKRFSRWGGGKLAAALYPRPVRCFVVSDVIGDDLAAIGSGPCVPDDATATEVRATLTRAGLWQRLPPRLRNAVSEGEEGRHPETPKSGDPIFADVQSRIVASNRLALEAVAARATALGLRPVVMDGGLAGEASTVGAHLANLLLRYQQGNGAQLPAVLIWGGETTVTLGDGKGGLGGRSQELALAAAQVLGEAGRDGVTLLAGGTDGRDGPTDAAGAVVDETTWAAIRRRGRDPATDLRCHDAYRALDAAGVLLKPGMTGTNVMDVVLGLVGSRQSRIGGPADDNLERTTDAPPPAAGSPFRGAR
jgi:hydroxypyruvate reductase